MIVNLVTPRRKSFADRSGGGLFAASATTVLVVLGLVPAVADTRLLNGLVESLRLIDLNGSWPWPAVVGSAVVAFWWIRQAERRRPDRRRRLLIAIASQIREAREEAERQRLRDAQAQREKRHKQRVTLVSTLFMIAVGCVSVAILARL